MAGDDPKTVGLPPRAAILQASAGDACCAGREPNVAWCLRDAKERARPRPAPKRQFGQNVEGSPSQALRGARLAQRGVRRRRPARGRRGAVRATERKPVGPLVLAAFARTTGAVQCRKNAVQRRKNDQKRSLSRREVGARRYTWGYDDQKQLGWAAGPGQQRPRRVAALDALPGKLTRVACGGAHTAVLTSSGKVYCWGDNAAGQCGRRGAAPCDAPHEVQVEGVSALRCGRHATLAIDGKGAAYLVGALNDGSRPAAAARSFETRLAAVEGVAERPAETAVSKIDAALHAAAPTFLAADVADGALGEAHALLVKRDGRLFGVGYNASGGRRPTHVPPRGRRSAATGAAREAAAPESDQTPRRDDDACFR